MDLSRVGEKLLDSVRSVRSLSILSFPSSDRPEIPERAAAAAAIARALAALPPHQRLAFPSFSEELGTSPNDQVLEELEEEFYQEDFDPVRHVLEHTPMDENDLSFLQTKATLRLAQLDSISERLTHHVMEHHEQLVTGMQLVMEVEQDLKVANVICMNGRRCISSSMHEVSRDLIVRSKARKRQDLLDMLPILAQLRHAVKMKTMLNSLIDDGNFFHAFQVLSGYLQIQESFSNLSAIQEMIHGVEAWLESTLQKLDLLLLSVCQVFVVENYITVLDAYALIGDTVGLVEKIQSFFMQEVLSETHSVLKEILQEDLGLDDPQNSRLTYSDLCLQVPEPKFRQCLLRTLSVLFKLMRTYYVIMSFQLHEEDSGPSDPIEKISVHGADKTIMAFKENQINGDLHPSHCDTSLKDSISGDRSYHHAINCTNLLLTSRASNAPEYIHDESAKIMSQDIDTAHRSSPETNVSNVERPVCELVDDLPVSLGRNSSSDQLRKESLGYVSQSLQRGRKNLWHLSMSRISVLLSCPSACSTSTYQFLKNYEDIKIFILSGEAFSGVEAAEFRRRLKIVCENYLAGFHRQNVCALKMVLERETWLQISLDKPEVVSLAGLLGDGAPLIVPHDGSRTTLSTLHLSKSSEDAESGNMKNGFAFWFDLGSPFDVKLSGRHSDSPRSPNSPYNLSHPGSPDSRNGGTTLQNGKAFPGINRRNDLNRYNSFSSDENEDLLADFIDEDSQLPSRVSRPLSKMSRTMICSDEFSTLTGSSLSLLRLMDKYARLMQKLGIVSNELFKGICHLFELYFRFLFEVFGQLDALSTGKGSPDPLTHRLRTALTRSAYELPEQRMKLTALPFSPSSPRSVKSSPLPMDITPTCPSAASTGLTSSTTSGLKERCNGIDTISHVAHVLRKSKGHLQTMLLEKNTSLMDEFYSNMVDAVPDLIEHIQRTTAKLLLNINGYIERIANAKWEVKDLGTEHNGYVDLLLGEFKHYRTRLAQGGVRTQVQGLLLEYGLDNVIEILIEGLSRVKRCTDEGRALMSLDLQVLMNGLQHFVTTNVKPKFQIVETFVKAYYLPETEYVHWAQSHQEYSRSQVVGLINLVATMKNWKRKSRLDVLEKIEAGS